MLNKTKGNMYPWVDYTFNPIKGKCPHDCSYCYMKRFPQPELHLDEKELKTDLGRNNKIFIGSSTDMFAENVPDSWILMVLDKCSRYDNHYFFQSKNPKRFIKFKEYFQELDCSLGTTIETNRADLLVKYSMKIKPGESILRIFPLDYVTIEPIMDFDLEDFVRIIKEIKPDFVNIGADSKGHNLPEPSKEKVNLLIKELQTFTKVIIKDNLKRIQ